MANVFNYQNQEYHTGDTVRVHLNVTEGDKTRIQIFEGIIIAIQNSQANKSFTVRKIGANSIGVERIIPVMAPSLVKIEAKSFGSVRRSKLYYLRQRIGKSATKVRTKIEATPAKPAKSAKKKTAPSKTKKVHKTKATK